MVVEGGEVGCTSERSKQSRNLPHCVEGTFVEREEGGEVRTDSPVQGPGTAAFPAA